MERKENEDLSDEFAIESEEESEAKAISVPVTQFQSRPAENVQGQPGKVLIKKDLFELTEDELQKVLKDPEAKNALIQKLIEIKPKSKKKEVPAKKREEQPTYLRKESPDNPENEADFKKAYAKLVNKIAEQIDTKGSELDQLLLSEEDMKKVHQSKHGSEKKFADRVTEYADKIRKKKDIARQEIEEKEFRECTFAPQVHKSERRKFEDFLNDQKRYLDKKQETIAKLVKGNMEKEEASIVAQPQINIHSKVLASAKEDEDVPVYERLFAKSKKMAPEGEEGKKEEEQKTVPKKREKREIALYEEAKKRQERWVQKQLEASAKGSSKPTKKYSRDPYVQNKFSKEFANSLPSTLEPSGLLSYKDMNHVLATMGFIKEPVILDAEPQENLTKQREETIALVRKIWEVLEGDQRGGISTENLKVFLGAVMKISLLPESTISESKTKYGSFTDKGEFAFTEAQAVKIHKDFILLYLNRTAFKASSQVAQNTSEFTFKPALCEHSVDLATTKKPTAGDRVESLLQFQRAQEAKLRKKKDEYSLKELEECTFKPNITEYSQAEPSKPSTHIKTSSTKPSADRCQDLYQLSKKIVKKDDKPSDEYWLEREKGEYTFTPQITKERPVGESIPEVPLSAETVERLKKAREERERIKKSMDRGVDDSGMRFDFEPNKKTESKLVGSASKQWIGSSAKKEQKRHSPNPEPVEESVEKAIENIKSLEQAFFDKKAPVGEADKQSKAK